MRHSIYLIAFRQLRVPAVDLVSDPPTQLSSVYIKPRCRTKFGERGFSHAGPTARNSLPHHLHHISDTGLFKRRLKTELFRRACVASCWRSWTIRKQRYRNDCIIIIMKDCSIVRVQQLQMLYRRRCCMSTSQRMFGSLWNVVALMSIGDKTAVVS